MALLTSLLCKLDARRPRPRGADLPNPYLQGNFAPLGAEHDTPSLDVIQGAFPADLRGAHYRMSPAPRFTPPSPGLHHWFDGDGMIDAFFVAGGRVSHKNRWVRTAKLEKEERAGHALFGGIRDLALSTSLEGWLAMGFTPGELVGLGVAGLLKRQPSDAQIRKVLSAMDRSNTSIFLLAGRLLSLVEGSGAHEIDPRSLATRGPFDFGGVLDALKGGMVAHPKVDPETGAIYTFGYWGMKGGITYRVIDGSGAQRFARDIETPYPAMMHDFSVTETHAVFYHLPAVLHMDEPTNPNTIRWEPSRGARIGVVSRDAPAAPVKWYEIAPCYVYHPLNAFDDGREVVLDVVRYPRLPLFDPGGESPNAPFDEYPAGKLTRVRLDLCSGETTETVLDESPCEFPIVDPRHALRRHRHGWFALRRGPTSGHGIMNAIGHIDMETGHVTYRDLGRATYTNEPVFVPRAAHSPEGDGYLLTTVHHADLGVSDLLLLDARNIAGEPIATARTKYRVPYGFHGTWVPDSNVPV